MQNALGELKVLVAKTNFGSILGIRQRDGVPIARRDSNDEAMKGMLMKAIRAARGEHLPRGPTLFRPRWYFIFRLPFPVLPLFSHLPSPSRFKGLLWKWFHSFFFFASQASKSLITDDLEQDGLLFWRFHLELQMTHSSKIGKNIYEVFYALAPYAFIFYQSDIWSLRPPSHSLQEALVSYSI